MKLSKRERMMLALLLFFALWILSFQYFIMPEKAILNEYSAQVNALEAEKNELDGTLLMKESFAGWLEVNAESDKADEYLYQEVDDVYADRHMQELAKQAGIELLSMEWHSSAEAAKESMETVKESMIVSTKGGDGEDDAESAVSTKTVVMEVRGSTEEVMNMVDSIYQINRSLIITGLDVRETDKADDSGKKVSSNVEGSITAVYYYLNQ